MTVSNPVSGPELLAALRAVAESTRLRLLRVCAQGELTVGELTRVIGQSQPRVSRHLKILCEAGLLVRFRERHWVFYRVPLAGTGARLVLSLLDCLDPDDPLYQIDQQRLAEVLGERARMASDYEATLTPSPVDDNRINEAVEKLLGRHRVGDLLDIGTGTGRLLGFLADRARQAIGVDISSEMLMIARSNLQAAGLAHCMVRHANMYQLPFTNESFDTVTLDQVLADTDDPVAAIGEAARILRSRGRLLLIEGIGNERNKTPIGEPGIRRWMRDAGIRCSTSRVLPAKAPALILCLGQKINRADQAA